MIAIKTLLQNYSQFLSVNWKQIDALEQLDSTGSFKMDWMQANWELLVEGHLKCRETNLEVYGEGADCNPKSSRVLYPERLPTHKITCFPLKGRQIKDLLNKEDCNLEIGEIIFDRFVTFKDDGWFYETPNFQHVLAEQNGKQVVLDFSELEFELKKIGKGSESV